MSERPSLDELMRSMPPQWRYRWCESRLCGCLGCANRTGRLIFYGYTREDNNEWIKNNPEEPQP